jgi:hypothetical protein
MGDRTVREGESRVVRRGVENREEHQAALWGHVAPTVIAAA